MVENPRVAVLVHDFAHLRGVGGNDDSATSGSVAITLYGNASMPTGGEADALRAAHLARNPSSAHFISDSRYAVVVIVPTLASFCNFRDEVTTWTSPALLPPSGRDSPVLLDEPTGDIRARAKITVAVGSKNATKLEAVRTAFSAAFPHADAIIEGFDVASGVSSQPMGDDETRRGALARAKGAAEAYKAARSCTADYTVGLEGGCGDDYAGELECFAWLVVAKGDQPDNASCARTATLRLPCAVAVLVRSGVELGLADDKVFGREGSKHKDGAVGLLTKGAIGRAAYYAHALTLALASEISPERY
jgi:inosine/xanthosine triphosphatase